MTMSELLKVHKQIEESNSKRIREWMDKQKKDEVTA